MSRVMVPPERADEARRLLADRERMSLKSQDDDDTAVD
jgi:hypothetical protein